MCLCVKIKLMQIVIGGAATFLHSTKCDDKKKNKINKSNDLRQTD